MRALPRVLRALLPLLVTIAILYAISRRIDVTEAFGTIGPDTLLLLVPALVAYGALSLCIDAISLMRAGSQTGRMSSFWSMARLKAASYPLGLVHYALGAGALAVLLRRRAGLALAEATGVVMLIAGFDMLAVLSTAGAAGAWAATDAMSLRLEIVGGLLTAGSLGLLALRSTRLTSGAFRFLEPLWNLRTLRAVREISGAQLAQLLVLRLLFVATFVALGGAALASFGIRPHPGTLIVGFAEIALVSAIPIAVAGLGTSQAAFLFVFRSLASAEQLLACSVALSAGIIAVRIALGVACMREFSRTPLTGGVDGDTDTPPTGERLDDASALYSADLARHRAAYRLAEAYVQGGLTIDLGCGTGHGTTELASRGARVVGIDRVAPAKRSRLSPARYVRGDLQRLPFATQEFDTVVSFQVIEHLAEPGVLLGEVARVLRPEGVLLISTPNRLQSDGENPYHLHEYEAGELEGALAVHFESVELRGVHAVGVAARYHADRLRRIRLITRLDPLRLRRRLPRGLVEWLFARLSILVRLAARRSGTTAAVGDEHFQIGGADGSLDLVAVCRGPKSDGRAPVTS